MFPKKKEEPVKNILALPSSVLGNKSSLSIMSKDVLAYQPSVHIK